MDAASPPPYRPRARRPFFSRGSVKLVIILALVGSGVWFGFVNHGAKGPSGPPPVTIRVSSVAHQPVPLTINAVGTVVAYESVSVRSRIDSQVVAVHFKDGDEVQKGDLLFELDDKSLKAQIGQLQANIARDRAQSLNAKRQYDRALALAEKGFATKATRDDAQANAQAAQATVGGSEAGLQNLQVLLGYTRILAPISGRTGTINVTLGNTVKANDTQPLVTINQLKPIRVQAALAQNYFDAVREAMQKGDVTVTASKQDDASASNAIAEGKLEYLDNAVDQATGTFVTRAGFENADERLWPGMFVTMAMTLGEDSNALTVPEVAVQRGQSGDYVYVIADSKALKREVKIVRMQNNLAVIASGLTEGEQVAIDGMLGLKDGAPVSIKTDAAPPAAKE